MNHPTERRPGRRPALLEELMAQYEVFRNGKPLAIGIHKALMEVQPDLDKQALRLAMKAHTQSTRYLKGIVEGAPRFDLAGQPAGTVTAEQRDQAVAVLKERQRKAAERRRAEEQAEQDRQREEKLRQLADKFNQR